MLKVYLVLQNKLIHFFHLFSSFLKTRSKTFWKVPCVSTRVSWKLRRMSRSPFQMTTTAPVAKARARVTKCLEPPSRYESPDEQCHSNLMGAHSRTVFKVMNDRNFTKVISHYHVQSSAIKYHKWPEPDKLQTPEPHGRPLSPRVGSVPPTSPYAAALAGASCQCCRVAFASPTSASASRQVSPADAPGPC